MNAHQEMVERFSPYVDAELPPAEEAVLEEHLGSCEPCRAEYADFAQAISLVRELPRNRLPSAFTRRVVARTRMERRRRLMRVRELVLPMVPAEIALPVVLLAVIAAVLVLVLLGT